MPRPFLIGNRLWKLRTTHGRDKIFSDAAVLWDEATAYFDWCDRHPREKTELVKYQGCASEAEVPLGRMYTIGGLMVYLGVSEGYFRSAKANLREKEEAQKATEAELGLLRTMEMIEQVIRTEQIEGAAVNIYANNFVARINGLADSQNVTSSGDAVLRVTVRDQDTADNMTKLDEQLR